MANDTTIEEFDNVKLLLTHKYAQLKAMEKEVAFLKKKFATLLEFRDENDWAGKTDFTTFKLSESFRVSYPGNNDLEKKGEFYRFMQKKDTAWFRQSVTLNWNAVNAYANAEIDAEAAKGNEWTPWPHCERVEDKQLALRVRQGVLGKLYDPKVTALGFGG